MRPTVLAAIMAVSLHSLGQAESLSSLKARHIAGGTSGSVYDYPFSVVVVANLPQPRTCSGSLVSGRWVLTAAHCVDGVAIREIVIVHGFPLYTETRFAVQSVMHPDYDPLSRPDGWAHDIALIRMESAFLSLTADTVAMADSMDSVFLQAGLSVTAVGWGSVSGNAERMTAAERQLTACSEIPAWAVCTESTGDPTIQKGDSGGSLLMEREGTWVLVAVNSWRDPTSAPAHSRYVRVAEHREWIDATMQAEPRIEVSVANMTEGSCLSKPEGQLLADVIEAGETFVHAFGEAVDTTIDLECGDLATVAPVDPVVAPPAPDPFQPQPVEVNLGEHGGTVTLMTAEGGGYTLYGQAFAGGIVTAHNGDQYLLQLQNDIWTATYQVPPAIEVSLGDHGGTLMIRRSEGGGYTVGGKPVESGSTVTGADGETYRLTRTMDEIGNDIWTAEKVNP